MSEPAIIVGMPSYRPIDPRTVHSLIHLLFQGGSVLDYLTRYNLYIDQARCELAEEALAREHATHLLLLDDDMLWPPDTIPRLLAHGKGVVSGLYFQRWRPYPPVAYRFAGKGVIPLDGWQPGLQAVDCVGLGCCLIQLDVLRRMAAHFKDRAFFRSEKGGEDLWFCRRLRDMGEPVWLDAELECGHLPSDVVVDSRFYRAARQ